MQLAREITEHNYTYENARRSVKERKCAWKKERRLTVYEGLGSSPKMPPRILLQGKWLQQAGFCTGDKITVHCQRGQLIITRDEPEIAIDKEK